MMTVLAVSPGNGATPAPQSRGGSRDPYKLTTDGNTALQEKRYRDAYDLYVEAARLLPQDASLQFLVGYSSYLMGLYAQARPSLERALALNPRLTDASVVLGMVHYRLGDVSSAVKALEAGLKHDPADKDLNDLLQRWRPEATLQSGFYETRGAHFTVLFQGPSDDFAARRIVELLEQEYYRIGGVLSTYPPDAIAVVLYTQEQFRSTGGVPDWAVGSYDGRIKIPTMGALAQIAELKRILAHEFTHAVVAQLAGGAAPRWLNEGLAELMESSDFSTEERTLERLPKRLPFSRLERDFNSLSGEEATLAYAQSAFAVRKMVDLRGMSAVVVLLQSLGRGNRFESAFQQAIAMRYEDFIAMVSRY